LAWRGDARQSIPARRQHRLEKNLRFHAHSWSGPDLGGNGAATRGCSFQDGSQSCVAPWVAWLFFSSPCFCSLFFSRPNDVRRTVAFQFNS
jgi:hypothetical protein